MKFNSFRVIETFYEYTNFFASNFKAVASFTILRWKIASFGTYHQKLITRIVWRFIGSVVFPFSMEKSSLHQVRLIDRASKTLRRCVLDDQQLALWMSWKEFQLLRNGYLKELKRVWNDCFLPFYACHGSLWLVKEKRLSEAKKLV